jgi:hypothetical protein
MFRPQILAIIRLYNENLSIGYTCICRGCIRCRVGSVSARSRKCVGCEGLGFGLVRNHVWTEKVISRHSFSVFLDAVCTIRKRLNFVTCFGTTNSFVLSTRITTIYNFLLDENLSVPECPNYVGRVNDL